MLRNNDGLLSDPNSPFRSHGSHFAGVKLLKMFPPPIPELVLELARDSRSIGQGNGHHNFPSDVRRIDAGFEFRPRRLERSNMSAIRDPFDSARRFIACGGVRVNLDQPSISGQPRCAL
jgi:hypothetical protein